MAARGTAEAVSMGMERRHAGTALEGGQRAAASAARARRHGVQRAPWHTLRLHVVRAARTLQTQPI